MSDRSLVEELVCRSAAAQRGFSTATQEQADAAARAVCKVVYDNANRLAQLAVDETHMGSVQDKIAKCHTKSQLIWNAMKGKKTVGVIRRIEEKRMLEIAKPMGVVASIVPSTNPVVTPMSNAAFAFKTRNSIVFSPHPNAKQCTKEVVALVQTELEKLGLPRDLILTIEEPTIQDSGRLMGLADVIVATGGMAMVKAAYSSGKPAFGVGAGNVQCIVDEDADLDRAAEMIIQGRCFDNGLICLGEQCVFVPEARYEAFVAKMREKGAYYIDDPRQLDRIREGLFPGGGGLARGLVGRDARKVSELLGLDVPEDTRLLLVRGAGTGPADVLCREKMCPVLTVMPYDTFEHGVDMMVENLEHEGKGHSIGIHSNDQAHIEYAATRCSVSRIVVNQPVGTSGGGSYFNGFAPTTTLGCGSWGNNSFSGNFSFEHLMNISRVGFPYDESDVPGPDEIWS